jgi:hypothetical protein
MANTDSMARGSLKPEVSLAPLSSQGHQGTFRTPFRFPSSRDSKDWPTQDPPQWSVEREGLIQYFLSSTLGKTHARRVVSIVAIIYFPRANIAPSTLDAYSSLVCLLEHVVANPVLICSKSGVARLTQRLRMRLYVGCMRLASSQLCETSRLYSQISLTMSHSALESWPSKRDPNLDKFHRVDLH